MTDSVWDALLRLERWVSDSGWVGYDPFDGLSAPLARRLTFEVPILRIVLQQTVRRFPGNLRPLLGITKKRSNEALGYFASGYLRLYQLTGQQEYLDKAKYCLSDLQASSSQGYAGYAWGDVFDYQSRGTYLPRCVPTVVWTSFVGHAFVDAYELLADKTYLDVARGACEFILRDVSKRRVTDKSLCISYFPHQHCEIHNANMLGASLLARVYRHTGEPELLDVARQAVRYTMDHQRPDGSWFYGEGLRWHWVDSYHTGFVADALHWYMQSTGDEQYVARLQRGMDFYRRQLFSGPLARHNSLRTYPVDIQPVAQGIQTFAFIPETCHGDLTWSEEIARWAIRQMQSPSGYFYFRKERFMTNKTPFLHWGQSTMLAALALLLLRRKGPAPRREPALAGDRSAV